MFSVKSLKKSISAKTELHGSVPARACRVAESTAAPRYLRDAARRRQRRGWLQRRRGSAPATWRLLRGTCASSPNLQARSRLRRLDLRARTHNKHARGEFCSFAVMAENILSLCLSSAVPAEAAWIFSAMSCSSVSATSNRYALIGPSVASAQKSSTTTPSTVRTIPIGCLPCSSPSDRPVRETQRWFSVLILL